MKEDTTGTPTFFIPTEEGGFKFFPYNIEAVAALGESLSLIRDLIESQPKKSSAV